RRVLGHYTMHETVVHVVEKHQSALKTLAASMVSGIPLRPLSSQSKTGSARVARSTGPPVGSTSPAVSHPRATATEPRNIPTILSRNEPSVVTVEMGSKTASSRDGGADAIFHFRTPWCACLGTVAARRGYNHLVGCRS